MPTIKDAGDYAVTVTEAEFGESDKGTPFLTLNFKTDDGDEIRGYLYLSDAALPYTIKTLREAFGFDGNFENIDPIIGQECSIKVVLEEYEGREKAKVQFINNKNGGFRVKPIANASNFLRSLSEKAKRLPAPAPAKATSAAKPAPKKGDPF